MFIIFIIVFGRYVILPNFTILLNLVTRILFTHIHTHTAHTIEPRCDFLYIIFVFFLFFGYNRTRFFCNSDVYFDCLTNAHRSFVALIWVILFRFTFLKTASLVSVALDLTIVWRAPFAVYKKKQTKNNNEKKHTVHVSITSSPHTADRYISIVICKTTTPPNAKRKKKEKPNAKRDYAESRWKCFLVLSQMDGTCSNTHLP